MPQHKDSTFAQVVFTHFIPCFFIGVLLLYLVDELIPRKLRLVFVDGTFSMTDMILALLCGLTVSLLVLAFHIRRNRRLEQVYAVERQNRRKHILYAMAVGFLGGTFDILLVLHNEGIIVLTAVVLFILIWHLRLFTSNIVTMLRPNNIATWNDVAELLRIYVTMMTGFTLTNATLEGAHVLAGRPAPFGFTVEGGDVFLNSLYYTVVTMTTLGYGDIVPTTWDSKLLLIFQCLVSYVMFALMIGIITRGVVRASEKNT